MGRDKLYSVIAHDLRSPMGSIKMVLNMLILNLPSETIGEEMYELLTMANQTTEDVFSLLDNLLKGTKSQIGKLKVCYQDINMVEVVEGVSEDVYKRQVYELAQERLKVIFNEFDNIYVSFSGGKDSGVLLNMCIDSVSYTHLDVYKRQCLCCAG